MTSSCAIETVNLTKEFIPAKSLSNLLVHSSQRKVIIAVNNINLRVRQSEVFCLIGPNGAGKTTLIKLLSSLILPTKGTAKVMGYDILQEEEKVKARIGFSSDEQSFYRRLTGRQNLDFFARLYNLTSIQAKNRIKELLDFLEIEEPDKRFQEYSTGVKQRLSIARCLLNNPRVIFMDEPTKSLDPVAAKNLRMFIKEELAHKQGKTIFFATHNVEEITYLADRLAIIDKGLIKASGTIDELRQTIGNSEATIEKLFTHFIGR